MVLKRGLCLPFKRNLISKESIISTEPFYISNAYQQYLLITQKFFLKLFKRAFLFLNFKL